MPISNAFISSDVYSICLAHALTTEKDEIMGLLIGDILEEKNAYISAIVLLRRSDKRADRVEISPEQLSEAANCAELLEEKLKKRMRIVGWYHSHPHITVWPSHIDLRTQSTYQMMDSGFIGLIFSVFNQDKSQLTNRIQVSCFQSSGDYTSNECERVEINMQILGTNTMCDSCIDALCMLPRILCDEEKDAYAETKKNQLHFLVMVHNAAVYMKSLTQIFECLHEPMMSAMSKRIECNLRKAESIKQKNIQLRLKIKNER